MESWKKHKRILNNRNEIKYLNQTYCTSLRHIFSAVVRTNRKYFIISEESQNSLKFLFTFLILCCCFCTGDTQKFVLDSPHNSIIFEQNISINLSKAKKTRPSCIHSDLELKIKLGELCEDGRGSETKARTNK